MSALHDITPREEAGRAARWLIVIPLGIPVAIVLVLAFGAAGSGPAAGA
jgi:hypothetical protein